MTLIGVVVLIAGIGLLYLAVTEHIKGREEGWRDIEQIEKAPKIWTCYISGALLSLIGFILFLVGLFG